MRPRHSRWTVVILATVAITSITACEPPLASPGQPSGECRPDPFTAEFQRNINAVGAAQHHVTAAVFDDRTGCWYHLRRGQELTTASVVKVEIMAATMLRAQSQQRGLTQWELANVTPMIHSSANDPASALWVDLGGLDAMAGYGHLMGLAETSESSPIWGYTRTTAFDQARFMHRLLQGDMLTDDFRTLAWWELRNIRSDQRWGVSAGVPPGWEVGQKNGFASSRQWGWRVNSVGYVQDPTGGGYSVAILSDGWSSLAQGVPMLDHLGATIAAAMTST